MAISDVSSKSFVNELMRLSLSIVWKNQYEALEGETEQDRRDAEAYIAARRGELNFYSKFEFAPQILRSFFPNDDMYQEVYFDKRKIPEDMRPAIVAAEQAYLIDQWENHDGEKNPYYRKLFGLPPVDMLPRDYLYNTRYADIDTTTPIHKLSLIDRIKLEKRGYFAELMAQHPDGTHDYLKFAGKLRIEPYLARQAEPYEILYMDESRFANLRRDFLDVYEECRRMMVRVYHSDAYRYKGTLYEGFIGMMILFAAHQRMCSKYIEVNITRDFYDLESLRLVYGAYGMPFYSSIPLKYHEKIVKRMNELIAYKGSTQVFYDTFGLFDFGDMDVFEYFLVKKRLVDSKGNPIFRDVYGKHLTDEQMWNIRFARVSWDSDKFVEVTKPENIIPYEELTVPDPYWVEDAKLRDKLYGRDWNYFHSKYMGVQIMFELSQLIFETCYFFRMLEDNRDSTENIYAYYMVTGTDIALYDLVIYAIALLCKNAGYTGRIPSDPASIAAVYGFNFTEYNELLKMTVDDIDTFVKYFKEQCLLYAEENPVLDYDEALKFWISQVTDGAFGYLGDDFPYGQEHMAPPPVFIHDFVPTRNSIQNLKNYLSECIARLNDDPSLTEIELQTLFQQYAVDHGDRPFQVMIAGSKWDDPEAEWQDYYLTRYEFTEEDVKDLRKVVLASYEHMLAWVIRLLDTRKALTFDPELLNLIRDMNVYDIKDVENVYNRMKDLDRYLTIKLQQCKSRMEYNVYANIRKILMTTQLVDKTFAKKNGEVAKTYEELLSEVNPTLYRRFISEDLDTEMEEQYVLQTLMTLCDSLKLLQAANSDNLQRVIDYLLKILKFLKSAKVDLVKFEVIFLISDRSMNYIKLINEIYESYVEDGHTMDWLPLYDLMHQTHIFQILTDRFNIGDPEIYTEVYEHLASQIKFLDQKYMKEIKQTVKDGFEWWFDWTSDIFMDQTLREFAGYVEFCRLESEFDGRDSLKLMMEYIGHEVQRRLEDVILREAPNTMEIYQKFMDAFYLYEQLSQENTIDLRDDILFAMIYVAQEMQRQLRDHVFLEDDLRNFMDVIHRHDNEFQLLATIFDRIEFFMDDRFKLADKLPTAIVQRREDEFRLLQRRAIRVREFFIDRVCYFETMHHSEMWCTEAQDGVMMQDKLIKFSEELLD